MYFLSEGLSVYGSPVWTHEKNQLHPAKVDGGWSVQKDTSVGKNLPCRACPRPLPRHYVSSLRLPLLAAEPIGFYAQGTGGFTRKYAANT